MTLQEHRMARWKYHTQKANSIIRNIKFNLTYEEWIHIWLKSGHWHERGRGAGKYCMSRNGDAGAYELGNVYINKNEMNASEGSKGKKKPATGIANSNRITKPETLKKKSDALKGKPQTKVTCPHCKLVGGHSPMIRYHFDNCKYK